MKNRNSNTMMRKVIDRKIFNNNKLLNNKLINNKITLFLVAALAFFSLYIHITSSRFSAVLLFFLTAALVYSFTNNMTIVLGASFVITTIASVSSGLFGFKEGADATLKEDTEEDTATKKDTETEEDTATKKATATTPNSEETEDSKEQPKKQPVAKKTGETAPFGNQKLSPALFNTPSKKNVEAQLGKASEVEQAYDNLEKIMGTEKISSISSETKDLIKQQNELIKQLKTMTPALNSAMSSLGNLDLNKLTGMFNSATKNLSELKDT